MVTTFEDATSKGDRDTMVWLKYALSCWKQWPHSVTMASQVFSQQPALLDKVTASQEYVYTYKYDTPA